MSTRRCDMCAKQRETTHYAPARGLFACDTCDGKRLVTGDVLRVDHAFTSSYGNPSYRITLVNGDAYVTQANAGIGYAARNFTPHSTRRPIVTVTLTLSRAGRVVDIRHASGQDSSADEVTLDILGYVSQDERSITDFNGNALLRVTRRSVTRTGFYRSTVSRYWAVSDTGAAYYGAGAGGSMSIRMRRVKGGR